MNDKDFDNLIKNKLDNFEVDVPSSCWEAIEQSLPMQTDARRVILWRRIAVAAILVLGVSLSGYLVLNKNNNNNLANTKTSPKPSIQKEVEKPTVIVNNNLLIAETKRTTTKSNSLFKKEKSAKPVLANASQKPITSSAIETAKVTVETPAIEERSTVTETNTSIAQSAPKSALTDKQLEDFIRLGQTIQEDEAMILPTEENSSLALLAALPGYSHSSSNSEFRTLRSTSTTDEALNILNSGATTTPLRKHSLPLSLGFLLNKKIYKNLSFETGIHYTYLRSEQENTGLTYYSNEIQKLHYLGIPVSLSYRYAQRNRFSFYGKIGGMVEKNVAGSWIDEIKKDNKTIYQTSTRSDIHLEDKLQWSLHTGLGVDYRIAGWFNFYLEPSFTYFPDNHSKIDNIRKKQNYEISLQGGFKAVFQTR
ncbi:MAG: porin family protein [Bacteroidales bacterium]|nr:porin family protein [Bacteroidales bacterium]